MEIWAHTLVKNEAKWLWYSVASIVDYVDKILLWDTGSTDGSLKIEKELVRLYPEKIILKSRRQDSAEDFAKVRQEMFEETKSDWFLMLDGDEIWWQSSINKVIETIKNELSLESIVVPTLNLVGDIYHYQDQSGGKYHLAGKFGHYNLRAINRDIPGLKSLGAHGVWGWADGNGKMIQNRNPDRIKFVDAPYLHTTFLLRGGTRCDDKTVIKRSGKYKYEFGRSFPKDFFYPEVFFKNRPDFIPSPWKAFDSSFKIRAFIETPLRKLKRRVWTGGEGY